MAPKALNSFSDSLSDEEFKTSHATDKETKTQNEIKYEHVKVKLCDFSFSQIMIPGQPILGMMGTVAYSGKSLINVYDCDLISDYKYYTVYFLFWFKNFK